MLIASTPTGPIYASPGITAVCPSCHEPVLPKCGQIVTWHWAHRVGDCDSWSEPESQWHLWWKSQAERCEVVMRRSGEHHRADIVTPTGWVVELQAGFLNATQIKKREAFYGRRMVWLYNASDWGERIHHGRKGFWWKHGAKSMAIHRRPLYWHFPDNGEVWRVRVSTVDRKDSYGGSLGERVLGKRLAVERDTAFARWLAA